MDFIPALTIWILFAMVLSLIVYKVWKCMKVEENIPKDLGWEAYKVATRPRKKLKELEKPND